MSMSVACAKTIRIFVAKWENKEKKRKRREREEWRGERERGLRRGKTVQQQ